MTSTPSQPAVDMAFRLTGSTLPLDHGYVLFGALSRALQAFRDDTRWGVHPVLGARTAPGILTLTARSRLKIRAPVDDIPALLSLCGKDLDIDGHRVIVGVPEILPLTPAAALKARFVTVKGFVEADPLRLALRRQLATLDLGQDPERVEVSVGSRRVIRVGPHVIVGFPVALTGLEAHASLSVQTRGLGGRRHMGGGVFVPFGRRSQSPAAESPAAAKAKA